ncbi:low affinity potassium transporter [Onygenales sp. PD_12]|nr:low affinity potassium transporter [Onygenales sp. PD_12]
MVGWIVMGPAKNLSPIDSFFSSVSAATTTGLNSVDVMSMNTYQQIAIYIMPLISNLSVINLVVVLVRLYWFETRFKDIVRLSRIPSRLRQGQSQTQSQAFERASARVRSALSATKKLDIRVLRPTISAGGIARRNSEAEGGGMLRHRVASVIKGPSERERERERERELDRDREHDREQGYGHENEREHENGSTKKGDSTTPTTTTAPNQLPVIDQISSTPDAPPKLERTTTATTTGPGHISFAAETHREPRGRALRIPGPREFESGQTVHEVDDEKDGDELMKRISTEDQSMPGPSGENERRKLPTMGRLLSHAVSIERAATNAFVLGNDSRKRSRSASGRRDSSSTRRALEMPYLSYDPLMGRNSKFLDLTDEQRDELGGIEYRSLKLLAKIVFSYYVFWHVVGVVCLVPWIHNSDPQYREYLREIGQSSTWWAFYTSMTAFNNLGYTLTPDSMASFREATFPMILMTFLIYIGNTGYPCMLRLIIWTLFKLSPRNAAIREPLNFLLDHPRRCYTLLFPSGPTWILFASLVFLNFVDVLLFLVLDLNNPEVTAVESGGSRFLAALFQAASARTTGTSTFNISKVHPGVQFTLMVMMYISVFPIAISVRRTNIYEESSLGLYDPTEAEIDESNGPASYLGAHMKKQLAFDLWYIFLGMFILTLTEGSKIADNAEPGFAIFSVFFEVVSAYGNVGLSLGHPAVNSSLTTRFSVLGKLVICAMMIRGRHRGLPYEVDRAIILPSDRRNLTETTSRDGGISRDLTIAVSARSRTT